MKRTSLTMMKKECISCTNLFLNDFSCLCQIKYPCEARAKKKSLRKNHRAFSMNLSAHNCFVHRSG